MQDPDLDQNLMHRIDASVGMKRAERAISDSASPRNTAFGCLIGRNVVQHERACKFAQKPPQTNPPKLDLSRELRPRKPQEALFV